MYCNVVLQCVLLHLYHVNLIAVMMMMMMMNCQHHNHEVTRMQEYRLASVCATNSNQRCSKHTHRYDCQ